MDWQLQMFLDGKWKMISEGKSVEALKRDARLWRDPNKPCDMRILDKYGKLYQFCQAEYCWRIRWQWPTKTA